MDSTALGRWAVIEAALAQAFRIDRKNLSAFRARLTVLQRGGLLGRENQVGKGTAIEYGRDEVWRLIFAVELMEAGFQPSMVLRIIKSLWVQKVAGLFKQVAESKPGAAFLALEVSLMSDSWSNRLPEVLVFRPNQGILLTQRMGERAALTLLNVARRWREFEAAFKQGDEGK
jgi:hypothetical protein